METVIINGKQWFSTVTRNMSFWHECLSNDGAYIYIKEFGIDAAYEILFLTKDSTKTSIFANKENYDKFITALIEGTNTLPKIEALKNKYEKFADELLSSLDRCNKNLTTENFIDFTTHYSRFTGGLNITTLSGRIYSESIGKRLQELGKEENEAAKISEVVTYPETKTPFYRSQIDLLKIAADVQESALAGEELNKRITEWLELHAFVPVNFCEEPYTEKDVKDELEKKLKINCRDEIARQEKQHEDTVSSAKTLLETLNDSELTRFALTLQEITSLNEFRKNVFCRASLYYRPLLKAIVEKCGSSNWRDAFYLTNEEMIDILSDKSIDLSAIIKARQIAGGYPDNDGKLVFLASEEVVEVDELLSGTKKQEQTSETRQTSIKGFSASKGKVTGVARIILSSKDFDRLNLGEILVTTMTSVDFVPVMERAGAFVTNEGGITSHASIVAREMKKPCIIGTKNATQVLQDGDMVEVDADNGIVKIIS